ncbi:MAG TPA: HEAT repeat domain-containing protein, partial [Thermoleophilia bacterium]|nr:HEAT repeat domain-containing protein [Thermoleophilia bacterium]
MKAVKVTIGLVIVVVGGSLIFVAFWHGMWLTHTSSPGVYFYLPFFIGLLCLSTGFSVISRATGFDRWRRGVREGKMLERKQRRRANDVSGHIEALRSGKAVWMRSNAAEALGGLGDARAVEPLVAALRSALEGGDWQVADASAKALGRLGDTRAVEILTLATAADDGD